MKDQGQGVAPKILEQDGESVRDFISMAVHDLREPLRGIRLGVHLLTGKDREPSEENVERGTRYLIDGVDRMETLIHDIAELCYEEVREPNPNGMDLELVLLEAKNELAVDIKSSGAILTHDALPSVKISAAIGKVFRALISNACKFRGEDGPRIHVGAVQRGSDLILSIQDNGTGFDPAYGKRVFRAFERLNGKQYPGSGLGLTLAKRIVEQQGGQIWAESRGGGGCTIHFSLPLAV
ncbi:MAG: ATP-binding protein [Acidobacteriota bacterium]